MSQENKVISIAVGDRLQIEGVGTVQLVVVAPEQTEQPKQHPLVGKWVRYINKKGAWNCIFNKWYPVTGISEQEGFYIQTGGEGWDNVAFDKEKIYEYFDLSNPCDFDCNMPEAVNPKYKVGDEVVVIDNNYTRCVYEKAFNFLGLKDKKENNLFRHKTKAVISNICFCTVNNFNLYALRDSEGNECVIGEEGIKLAGIDKQEWLDAASRLFDSWMKISGGYVPKENDTCYSVSFTKENEMFTFSIWSNNIDSPFNFETLEQKDQFLSENEKDLKTFFHQV
jgi:hypothetical protein